MEFQNIIVLMDLDNFKEISNKMGWTKYKPNIITGNLTNLIKELISKHFGTILFGLNEREGTEECMILFTAPDFKLLLDDLENIRKQIEDLGIKTNTNATISIGVAIGQAIDFKPSISRKSDRLYSDPLRNLAKLALKEAKRKGGNKIIIK